MLLTKLTDYTPKKEIVPVPELGEGAEIIVSEMVGVRAKGYSNFLRGLGEKDTFSRTVFVIFSMVDEQGNQCHSIDEMDEVESILPPAVLQKIVIAAMKINHLLEEDIHKKKVD